MSATSVRIKESVLANLRAQAEQLGVSMQSLVDDVLDRELSYGPHYALRPLALPTGLLPAADEAFNAAKENPRTPVMVVLYHDRSGSLASIAGQVTEVMPTTLQLRIWQNQPLILLPRDAVRAWYLLERDAAIDSRITSVVLAFQAYGAILHPLVTLANRRGHGLL